MKTSTGMQKKATIKTYIIVISSMLLFISCKPLRMINYTERGTDTYCIYKISSVKNPDRMQALKKGDVICLYCPGTYHCLLTDKRWVKVYQSSGSPASTQILKKTGISYYLVSDNPSASCTNCPGTNTFQFY